MKAFVTGSYAYGKPTKDSDVDLVVRIGQVASELLQTAIGDSQQEFKTYSKGLRFGKLNLLMCTTDAQYDAWLDGTLALVKREPVTRDEAIIEMTNQRRHHGVIGHED